MNWPIKIIVLNLVLNLIIYYFHPFRKSDWAPKPLHWSGPKANLFWLLIFLLIIIPFVVFFFIFKWLEKARIKENVENENLNVRRKFLIKNEHQETKKDEGEFAMKW